MNRWIIVLAFPLIGAIVGIVKKKPIDTGEWIGSAVTGGAIGDMILYIFIKLSDIFTADFSGDF